MDGVLLACYGHLYVAKSCRQLDDGSSTEDRWTGYYRDYRESDGIVTPRTMEAVWNLMSGDFAYALLHITENKRWDCLEAKQYLLAA